MRKNWKRWSPSSLRQALEGCKDFAREKKNLSVERLAEQMGLADHYLLYKWLQTGRMPANMIPPFELACGADFVTRWMTMRNGHLVISIPAGQASHPEDMQVLQGLLNDTLGVLMRFYAGRADAESTLSALNTALAELSWHRENVAKSGDPELDFEEGE